MIEFKGKYIQHASDTRLEVLVQFDGNDLHIWHVLEPFFKLATYTRFNTSRKNGSKYYSVNLPNGDRIDTNDQSAGSLIKNKLIQKKASFFKFRPLIFILFIAIVMILISIGLVPGR